MNFELFYKNLQFNLYNQHSKYSTTNSGGVNCKSQTLQNVMICRYFKEMKTVKLEILEIISLKIRRSRNCQLRVEIVNHFCSSRTVSPAIVCLPKDYQSRDCQS